ncbi:MAG: DUF485 domain-containing protein [Phycisphaerales bacterium]|nr:DUF485 domain-containing protein [Anaerolinea sp.]MDW8263648.1 DUF485 domain-containing protein [Phycisphaerales bacterium]
MSDRPGNLYEAEHADRHNARLGIIMFVIYLVVYAGFVGLCAFRLSVMETEILGVNLAIVYGLGLIGFAFVLAVIYLFLCHPADGGRQ